MTEGRESFVEQYGRFALVAGSCQGLGAAFADALAVRGLDLILVDLDAEALNAQAKRVARAGGVEVVPVALDLGSTDLLEQLTPIVGDRQIGLLVYNAARSHVGSFLAQTIEDKLAALDVNCRGPLSLAHALAPEMVRRGRGGLIFMSSLAGMLGHRLTAGYAATKAFNLVLAEALWDELAESGVDVLAVCPGMTRTPGFERSGPRLTGLGARLVMEPEEVVRIALADLGRQPVVVPGLSNRVTALLTQRLLPRSWGSGLMGRMVRSIYPGRGP